MIFFIVFQKGHLSIPKTRKLSTSFLEQRGKDYLLESACDGSSSPNTSDLVARVIVSPVQSPLPIWRLTLKEDALLVLGVCTWAQGVFWVLMVVLLWMSEFSLLSFCIWRQRLVVGCLRCGCSRCFFGSLLYFVVICTGLCILVWDGYLMFLGEGFWVSGCFYCCIVLGVRLYCSSLFYFIYYFVAGALLHPISPEKKMK